MPRRPRLELPGVPLHITHRGVNRAAIFIDDDDRRHYLHLLRLFAAQHAIAVHAYVLMDNHVHLLTTCSRSGATSAALRRVAQCYVQMFNYRHRRSGTLWEGRFKSCLVDSERYVLTVYRYIERNPVRARLVATPEEYRWSSVHANLERATDPLVTPHRALRGLESNSETYAAAYRKWLHAGDDEQELCAIRAHLIQQRAFGDVRFQAMVEKILNRPATTRPRGRPARHLREEDV